MQNIAPAVSPNSLPTAINRPIAPAPFHVLLKPTGPSATWPVSTASF